MENSIEQGVEPTQVSMPDHPGYLNLVSVYMEPDGEVRLWDGSKDINPDDPEVAPAPVFIVKYDTSVPTFVVYDDGEPIYAQDIGDVIYGVVETLGNGRDCDPVREAMVSGVLELLRDQTIEITNQRI